LSLEAKLDLYDMLQRYTRYGWTKKEICRTWDISLQAFRSLKKDTPKTDRPRRIQLNTITPEEKQKVIDYALIHTELNHREMAYRMIDEDIAFMSPSSVYRILRENNLLQRRGVKDRPEKWNPHAALSGPDEVWQTDLMVIRFRHRDYYLLSYFDVYSRFAAYHEVCLFMTGDSIKHASKRAVKQTGRKPKVIQSDNGSCYISSEYRSFIDKSGIEHRTIHPHCPNENAEIERYHRTMRELVDPTEVEDYTALLELVKERISYYNFERYHSAIGFVTPYAKDSGKAEAILESRKRKLQKAKDRRIKTNLERIEKQKQYQHRKAA
jgi:transposase InsO family protein